MAEKKDRNDEIEIWRNFLVYHDEVTSRIESVLKKEECISLAWYDILIVLERSKDKSLTMKELIKETVITKSGVSKILDRIEDGKLIIRKKSQEDARSVYIHITKQGSLEVRRAWSIYKENIHQLFLDPLDTTEKETLMTILLKLRGRVNTFPPF